MKHDLNKDWDRVVKAWQTYKENHWNPSLVLSITIYELRKLDRGIDYPLRRLLDSKEYGNRIRTYGAPTHHFGRYPFRWDKKHWLLIRVKTEQKISKS